MRLRTGKKLHHCKQCGKNFPHPGKLKVHMRLHTGEKPYECKQCGKKFTQSGHLTQHMNVHTGEKPYQCKQCRKKFLLFGNLNQHLMLHTGEKPHKCKHCGKTFARLSGLKLHLRVHTGEKLYKCKLCRKRFRYSCNLQQHMRFHTGEKSYQCNQCKRKFTQSCNLNRHMRVHTGVKPYQCNQCRKKFTQSGHLKRHMTLHTGEKPRQCVNCWKKFPTSSQVSVQTRSHNNNKQYICKQCGNGFDGSTLLKQHVTIHSREEVIAPTPTQLTPSASELDFNSSVYLLTQDVAMFMEPSMFTLQTISYSLSCSPPACYSIIKHPNIAVTYGVTVSTCGSMLVMEKVVTCLSDLLVEAGHEVTVRERVDICYGIVCAVDYLHHHVGIVHGHINVYNVFVTSRLTAKLLDPSAAFLMHDKMCQHAESFAHDLHHLICLLITTLYDMHPSVIFARDRLRDMISSEEIKKEREECISTSVLLLILDELRDTDEYHDCSRKRELFCDDVADD